ncbi:zinc-binding dehydrogenase, partial [Paenibacillus forsythiae]
NLVNRINKAIGIAMQTTVVFDYNNVDQLASYIIREYKPVLVAQLQEQRPTEERDTGTEDNPVLGAEQAPSPIWKKQTREVATRPQKRDEINTTPFSIEKRTGYYRVVIDRPEGVEDLRIVESIVPDLAEDEVRISVRAFSLNFGDLLCVRGLYPTMPAYPFTPGFEASGIVTETGKAVTTVKRGDEVIAAMDSDFGGQANMIACKVERVFRKPRNLSFEEACTLPSTAIALMNAFRKARLKKGESILIQSAAGGLGLAAVQLARHYGAEIYATAGSSEKLDYLQEQGVAFGINYLEADFEQEIMRLTNGRGVHVIINTLPGDAIQKGMNCLAPGGRYIELAVTALKSAKTIDLSVLSDNQSFYSINSRKLTTENPDTIKEYVDKMLEFVEQGVVRPTVYRTIPFTEIRGAYRCLEERKNIGKVVVGIPYDLQFGQTDLAVADGITVDKSSSSFLNEPVAIVGMSGRFARSRSVDELWTHLANGTDLVQEVTRWDLSDQLLQESVEICRHGSFLDGIDEF